VGDELFSPVFHAYDTFGNHIRTTDAYGRYVVRDYDAVGQMVARGTAAD
jgi:YD repeat-containing protein